MLGEMQAQRMRYAREWSYLNPGGKLRNNLKISHEFDPHFFLELPIQSQWLKHAIKGRVIIVHFMQSFTVPVQDGLHRSVVVQSLGGHCGNGVGVTVVVVMGMLKGPRRRRQRLIVVDWAERVA